MKGTCVAILCLLGVAMGMGGDGGGGEFPPVGPPSLKFVLKKVLDGPAREIFTGILAGRCRQVFIDDNIDEPEEPTLPSPPEGDKRKLSNLLARYLSRQKRGTFDVQQDPILEFCLHFMFVKIEEEPEAPVITK